MESRLRVATDGRAFTARAGGVRRYVHALFGAMAVRGDVEIFAVGASRDVDLPAGVRAVPVPSRLPTNVGWSLDGWPRALQRLPVDLVHAPAYTAPLWGRRPIVLTVHDVSYARGPSVYPGRLDPLRRAFFRRSARRADRIITDSAFSRREIVDVYAIAETRIAVVPLGVDSVFAPGPEAQEPATPFVLHVGDLHTRRDLPFALSAVLALRRDPRWPRLRLVLVGRDLGVLADLRQQATRAGDPEALDYRERVDESMLVRLYQDAAALVYPSRYEGFGLPVLEALACGTPVIAADAASIPEVLGAAGRLVAPGDATVWLPALRAVLEDPDARRLARTRGPARAAAFTWARCAEQTVEVYRDTLASWKTSTPEKVSM